MDQKKERTRRVTVTLPEEAVEFYASVVHQRAMHGERITTSELVRDAVAEHVKKLRRQRR